MGQFYYNKLRNNRIKGTFLGLLVMLINVITIYVFHVTVKKEETTVFHVVAISFIGMGLLYLLKMIPFGQIIEVIDDGHFATYYRLGTKKLKYKTFVKPVHLTLQQDTSRYYCLTVKAGDGHSAVLEKYPTLSEATGRLNELRTILD